MTATDTPGFHPLEALGGLLERVGVALEGNARAQDRLLRYFTMQPSYQRREDSLIVATATDAFSLGGPMQGMQYKVRSIIIGGLTPSTAAAGTADIFSTAGVPYAQITSLAQLPLADWRDHAASLPNIAFYGLDEITLNYPEKLVIVLSNATIGQQYVAAASVTEVQLSPAPQVNVL